MEVVSAFAARLRGEVPVNVGAVMAENQALRQQNQALWQRIQELETSVRIWGEDYELLQSYVRIANAILNPSKAD